MDFEITKTLLETKAGKKLEKTINTLTSVVVGKEAPNFSAPNPEGKVISLKESLGKVTIIDFWASWCGPCRALAPVMEGIKGEYTDVVFETIDVDVDHEQASKFAIRSVPTVVFVKDGVEVDRLAGVNAKMTYENKINEYKA